MQGAWREFGYVHLLRSATSVTPAEYRRAKRSGDFSSFFIASRDQLLTTLNEGSVQKKGRCRLESIGPATIKTRDRYGSYSVGALLCHGTFWKAAVDELLDRMDLVALDLSGFLPENVGTHYELQRVIDRFPIEGVVFLADDQSNARFITEQLQTAWSHMAAGSPNAGHDPKTALVVRTDSFVHDRATTVQSIPGAPGQPPMQQTQTTEVRTRLVARRADTRRVAAMAQSRLDQRVAMGVATADRRVGRPGVR